ncbi:ribosome biogenesis GTPase Der [Patescibacteria group bacterium]|nr:ribosome biogenesis GTPase Der [Patescibacteria group bacterium]
MTPNNAPTLPKLPRVALVGRTNVGKSTFWNRLSETTVALVSDDLHTTRDRNYTTVLWRGKTFEVIDTGGMDTEKDEIGTQIREQAELAVKEADLVLFLVDTRAGILIQDQQLAHRVYGLHKRVWLVANKADNMDLCAVANQPEFYQLKLGAPRCVSATTSLGIGDLLDDILTELERIGKPALVAEVAPTLKLAIVGRPNVGKSSIMNAILGEERVIVSPIAHTTREPQHTELIYKGHHITLIDTAGMRKKSHVDSSLEVAGIDRNEQAIRGSDVAILVFDSTTDPTTQDRHLAGFLEEEAIGLILVANKWDLVKDKLHGTAQEYEGLIRQSFPFLSWAPLVFTSAINKQRTTHLLDMAIEVQSERLRHIDYNAVNKLLKSCIKTMKPLASYGPKSPRIYDAAQISEAPPTFLVTVHGEKDNIHPNWIRFFEKRLRAKFSFSGTPIIAKVRNIPVAKSQHGHNIAGPGMEAVAGKIREKKVVVNQTRRRQKYQ